MMKIQRFTHDDVQVTHTETAFRGFFKMMRYQLQHKLFAGGWSKSIQREMFERGHAVALLPYDPVTDEFVLIQQFRLGAMATCDNPWLVEVIAGMIDEGYSAEDVCHKEAMEEAGISLTHLQRVTSYLSSPGGTTERIDIFVARTDSRVADGVHGCIDEAEDIKVLRVKREDARQWLNNGIMNNAAGIIALQHFFLNEAKLINALNTHA